MKKVITAITTVLLSGFVHASEVNLVCSIKIMQTSQTQSAMRVSINPANLTASIGSASAKLKSDSVLHTLTNQAYKLEINRSDLSASLSFMGNNPTTGQCEIAQTNNKI